MIKLIEVSKSFGSQLAVDNLSFETRPKEVFGFIGPNGAGKTTTIKMIAGVLKPTSGRIEIAGHDVQKVPEKAKRLLGYVPDTPFLYERLTAREYLQFVGGLYQLSSKEIDERSQSLFSLFAMDGWVDRKCEQYSHGMRQKLVFCAALLHRPVALVVDEPIVGLDPQSTRLVKDLLKQYAEQGNTVLISTHILAVAEELCDRIAIINKGRLVISGTLAQLKSSVTEKSDSLEELFLRLTQKGG